MLSLEDLQKIKESLEELGPNAEDFSWGPTYEFAKKRKADALKIIRREIRERKWQAHKRIPEIF